MKLHWLTFRLHTIQFRVHNPRDDALENDTEKMDDVGARCVK